MFVHVFFFFECGKLFAFVFVADAREREMHIVVVTQELFPFWEHPSFHLFSSSLASMPPDCH